MMTVSFIILLLFCLPWLLIGFVYPWQVLAVYVWKHPEQKRLSFLALPYRAIAHFTRSGWEKFCVVHIGELPSCHLRKWLYQGLGATCGSHVVFRYGTEIWCSHWLKVGKGSIGGYNMLLDARNGIEIGRYVNFSANVSVYTEQHDHRAADFSCNTGIKKKVTIGDRVWIGPNAILLPGITIGEGAVVAAGSVVTHDVAPYTVVGGIPAKKINDRPRELTYVFEGKESRIY